MSDVINVAVRYVITDLDPIMQPDPIGAWVHMEDYHAQTARIEELEAELEIALEGLKKSQQEIDDYIRQEYPQDIPLHERYRMRDFSANPARSTIEELKGETDE